MVLGRPPAARADELGAEDAPYIARNLLDEVQERDLQSLPNRHMYVRLLIDGEPSKPFSAVTETPTLSGN